MTGFISGDIKWIHGIAKAAIIVEFRAILSSRAVVRWLKLLRQFIALTIFLMNSHATNNFCRRRKNSLFAVH
jgi:hypothetical protein